MSDLTLYLGNKAYSSWSMRAWLAAKRTGLSFREEVIPLEPPGTRTTAIAVHSPSGRVPALRDGELVIWESLAIIEYFAELASSAKLWPQHFGTRAVARAVSAEMASGFAALRSACPCNVRRVASKPRVVEGALADDVRRIDALITDCRTRFGAGGPFLFGELSAADAMYAPVATRFRTYGLPASPVMADWMEAIFAWPDMVAWIEAAHAEPWTIAEYEAALG